MKTPHCPTCDKVLTEIHGTINRRWRCEEHDNIGGDKVVNWKVTG
jgi:hypothetical protein